MILFSLAAACLMFKLLISLMKVQDERYKIKKEQDRQHKELMDALRYHARMK